MILLNILIKHIQLNNINYIHDDISMSQNITPRWTQVVVRFKKNWKHQNNRSIR